MKNFIVRTITAVFFVAAIVSCFLRAEAMIEYLRKPSHLYGGGCVFLLCDGRL